MGIIIPFDLFLLFFVWLLDFFLFWGQRGCLLFYFTFEMGSHCVAEASLELLEIK
jgi:dipeptide/tripeptide permease